MKPWVIYALCMWLTVGIVVGLVLGDPMETAAFLFGTALWAAMIAAAWWVVVTIKMDASNPKPGPTPQMRWCPNCERTVRPVRASPGAGVLLTGGVGYLLKVRDSCPICRTEQLPKEATT